MRAGGELGVRNVRARWIWRHGTPIVVGCWRSTVCIRIKRIPKGRWEAEIEERCCELFTSEGDGLDHYAARRIEGIEVGRGSDGGAGDPALQDAGVTQRILQDRLLDGCKDEADVASICRLRQMWVDA